MKKEFIKTIIFTKTPLKKWFRYKDIFQIYPADFEGMPRSNLQQHFPVVLEYWTSDKDHIDVDVEYENLKASFSQTATQYNKQDKLLSLLTVFTNHVFFRYTPESGFWGVAIQHDSPGQEADSWPVKWVLPEFHWPEMAGKFQLSEFSTPEIQEVDYIDHLPYYFQDPNFDSDTKREITFPNTIDLVLDTYFSTDEDERSVLDSAISYAVSAMELMTSKRTLSLLSSFTSVETMVNLEYRSFVAEKCDGCGQLKHSVSKKYRDYLLKYIGDSISNKKKFNEYYSLRSRIVHTGKRLRTEDIYVKMDDEERLGEYKNMAEVLLLGKLAIIQWLLKKEIRYA
ncbi:hypothetical protein ACFQRK_23610 [Parapedobacter sp. GCM10030251]|uniref:hypothetical protein n=1 Tax=Parapedobacter sp. GCM10030251 TaxID=3273419 RepID=UPI00361D4020